MKLFDISGDRGKTWTAQWLTPDEVLQHKMMGYTIRPHNELGSVGNEDVCEFIGQIIDIFEDFLESKGIDIPNQDKEQSGDSAAIIYGMDYGELQSELEAMMQHWGVLRLPENKNGVW
jgi:hypothetical protein